MRQSIVNQLSPTEYGINTTVLDTAHSVIAARRAKVRVDALLTAMNAVLAQSVDQVLAPLCVTCDGAASPCAEIKRARLRDAWGCGARRDSLLPQLRGRAIDTRGCALGVLGTDGAQDLPPNLHAGPARALR
jgi:hypothetical protein